MIMAETSRQSHCRGSNLRAALMIIPLLMISACSDVPRPFQGAQHNDGILNAIMVNPGVMIAPLIGPPSPHNQIIVEDIARAAQARDIAAVTRGGGRNSSLLQGRVEQVPGPSGQSRLHFVWMLSSPDGIIMDTLESDMALTPAASSDPWVEVGGIDFGPVIAQVADFLASRLVRPSAQAALPERLPEESFEVDGIYYVYLRPIKDAPGDGNRSLRKAMTQLLTHKDLLIPVVLDRAPRSDSYVIAADVDLTTLSDEVQQISIDWTLESAAGEVLGTISQQNDIPRGSLNGKWKQTALYAAQGAAEGLFTALLQFPASKERPQPSTAQVEAPKDERPTGSIPDKPTGLRGSIK